MPFFTDRARALLRFSERYTKTDMVYVARGGFWISFGQAAASILSLLLVIAFANLLPKETYGMYRYILSLAGVLNIFALTGMNSAVARAVAGGDEGALSASVRYQLRWNIFMCGTFMALALYYALAGNLLLAGAFVVLGIFVPPTLAFNTYGAYLEGKKEFRLASIYSVISTFIYSAGMLAAIYFSGEVLWLIGAYATTTFAATAFFYFYVLRKFKPPKSSADETLRYGRQLTFIGFMEPIAAQVDKIILTHFWGPAQLAAYSIALAIPNRAQSFIKGWVGLGFPKFAEKTVPELNTMFYTRILQGMALGALIALAYVALAPYVFRYLLPQYLDALGYSQILALTLVFAMPNRYISLLFTSQKLVKRIFVNSALLLTIQITLLVLFALFGGITGLVVAYVVNAAIGVIVGIISWRYRLPT